MLTGNHKKIRGSIQIDNKTIENKSYMKILGTIFSEDAKFNKNVTMGTNSLLTQLKRRSSAIIRISKSFNLDFKKQLVHTLLIGKINFNIPVWGNICMELKNKINNIIYKTVNGITSDIWFGRETRWKLKQLNIPSYFQILKDSCFKQTFKYLNTNHNNMMSYILTKNRNMNLLYQNKCSSFNPEASSSYISLPSFNQQMRKRYNALPRGLTLSPNIMIFSKWLNKYHSMIEFDCFPLRIDNRYTHIPNFSIDNINSCINS